MTQTNAIEVNPSDGWKVVAAGQKTVAIQTRSFGTYEVFAHSDRTPQEPDQGLRFGLTDQDIYTDFSASGMGEGTTVWVRAQSRPIRLVVLSY